MKKLLVLIVFCPLIVLGQVDTKQPKKEPSKFSKEIKKIFKYSTFYAAMNGNNSISDGDVYSITPQGQLSYDKTQTPFDFSIAKFLALYKDVCLFAKKYFNLSSL